MAIATKLPLLIVFVTGKLSPTPGKLAKDTNAFYPSQDSSRLPVDQTAWVLIKPSACSVMILHSLVKFPFSLSNRSVSRLFRNAA